MSMVRLNAHASARHIGSRKPISRIRTAFLPLEGRFLTFLSLYLTSKSRRLSRGRWVSSISEALASAWAILMSLT